MATYCTIIGRGGINRYFMEYSVEEIKEFALCSNCIGDAYLKAKIAAEGDECECHYCGATGSAILLDELAELVDQSFRDHFQRTSENPDVYQEMALKDRESSYEWEREGERTADAIMNAADIPEQAADDVQAILEDQYSDFDSAAMGQETEYAEDAYYEEAMPTDSEWRKGWENFERSIRSEARFFSQVAATQLAALFEGIDQLKTSKGRPLIVNAGARTRFKRFFRARVFQSEAKLTNALERPDNELAAPPSRYASAGRMNAKGISTFYGATKPGIALAEVRPPVGSQVLIASFLLTRRLRLLDLNALENVHVQGSIFDPRYARELGKMLFLRSLTGRMSRPVMPDDQDVEYLPTQAIADYLATQPELNLDGILFPSVQAGGGGLNVVLFNKASRCELMALPEGTTLEARTGAMYEEGWEREFVVWEEAPEEKSGHVPSNQETAFDLWESDPNVSDDDTREAALRVELDSLRVHLVKAVSYKSDEDSVRRHRMKKVKAAF